MKTILFAGIPEEYREAFHEERLKTNVARMQVFSIFLVAQQIVLNVLNILRPEVGENDGLWMYISLSAVMLILGTVFGISFRVISRRGIRPGGAAGLLVNALLYAYMAIQLMFATLNITSTGDVNSYIIVVLVLGLVPVMRPLQSVTGIVASFAYIIAVLYITRNDSEALATILRTDLWTNLIIITGLVSCISVLIYKMYVSSFIKSVAVERSNDQLRNKNDEIASINEQLEIIANTDQMTGVSNRRALSRNLQEMWIASRCAQESVALAIFDIDFFKSYNDEFGHLAGDVCLQKIASCLAGSFRRVRDVVYRYGGEEFLVVFEAGPEDAFAMAEYARGQIEDLRIPHAKTVVSPYVTISVGVCVLELTPDHSIDTALKYADDALYRSKREGRNRTTLTEYDSAVA